MPNYDFDTPVQRRHTDSIKWRYPEDVLPMWVADIDFMAPPQVIAALQKRVAHGVFGYHFESPTLRDAVVAWVERRYGWKIRPDWLLFLPDVVSGMNLAAQSTARPGDGVLLQTPVYAPFFDIVRHGDFQKQDVPLEQDESGRYLLNPERLSQAITERSRLYLLCNPQNPTGRVFTREELEGLAQLALEHDLIILADEIHADLIYSESRHIPIASLDPEIARRTITFIAPSKSFNIAGLKTAVGIVPNPALRKRMEAGKRGFFAKVNVLGLVAMEAAYGESEDWLDALLAYLQANRDHLWARIDAGDLPGVRMARPEGTFLAWLDFRGTPWADAPARHIREKARLVVNEGSWFGQAGQGFVRLNFGCSRVTLDEALTRLRAAMGS